MRPRTTGTQIILSLCKVLKVGICLLSGLLPPVISSTTFTKVYAPGLMVESSEAGWAG